MLDFLYWFISQFFNIFNFLDSIVLINGLTLLKLLFLLAIFSLAISILYKGKGG